MKRVKQPITTKFIPAILCKVIWIFSISIPNVSYAEWPEQSCSLRHRIPVTITAVSGTHNTETRIDLNSTDFPADYIFSNGGEDIRVFESNDVTPVDFVVTGWDSGARTAVIYTRMPSLPSGLSELIHIYFGDSSLPSGSSAPTVFPDVGLRLRSRVTTADPISAASGLAAFAAATTDVDDSIRPAVSGLNNRALGGTNGNYAWCVSAIVNVTSATAGVWGFRYGADFGRGGHLYVSGQSLEEDWNDDLWWANNFANTGETLEGTVTLAPGWHRYEALGFEGCCDGATGFQAQAPGGPWQDLATANFVMRGAQCVNLTSAVNIAPPESCRTDLILSKSVAVDVSSESSLSIPGSVVRYDIVVNNPGQSVDPATLVLTDVFPPDVALIVTGTGAFSFTEGAIPSGLGFSYGGPTSVTDSVEFSIDGTNFNYLPLAPVDDTVTHIRIRPTGTLNPNNSGAIPSFSISVLGVIR